MRTLWSLGIAVAALAALAPLTAQPPPPSRYEVGLGFTMQTPPDVNLRPHCEAMSLPCGSPKTFPDFGLAATVAAWAASGFGVASEVGAWGNQWRSSSGAEGQETNWVRYAMAGPALRSRIFEYTGTAPAYARVHFEAMAGVLGSTLGAVTRVSQIGVAFDGWTKRGVWVRFQLDWNDASNTPRDISGGRGLISIVVPR